MADISMGDDRLDSRIILDWIDSAEDEIEAELEQDEDTDVSELGETIAMWRRMLEEAAQDAGDSPEDGIFFVRDEAWEDYAREFADDIGAFGSWQRIVGPFGEVKAVDPSTEWPFRHLDWKAAAEDLREGYTSVDVDWEGSTYTYWYQ